MIFVPTLIAIRVNFAGETGFNNHLRRPAATSSVIMVSHKQISKQSGSHLPPAAFHCPRRHFAHPLFAQIARWAPQKLRPKKKQAERIAEQRKRRETKERAKENLSLSCHVNRKTI